MSLLAALSQPGGGVIKPVGEAAVDSYFAIVNATSPVAWWRFGGNLNDSIGVNHGVLGAGTAQFVIGLPANSNTGFNCMGANWVEVPHASTLKPVVGSLMAWFKPGILHNGIVMAANDAGSSNPADFVLRVNATGTVSCFFQQGGVTHLIETTVAYYSAGQIIHAGVIFNTAGFSLWLDGQIIDGNSVHTAGLTGNTLAWRFGNEQASSLIFNGVLDEIAIWNRALTPIEILGLTQLELPPAP